MGNLKQFLNNISEFSGTAPPHMCSAVRPISVVVIQPPKTGCVESLEPQIAANDEGIGFKPPLGILYLASTLKDRTWHHVEVIDAQAERLSNEQVIERVQSINPEVVGISAWTDFWYSAYHLGEGLKRALPDSHICYGGPHLGIYPEETLDLPFVDSVIVGDGEIPFVFLCNMVANGNLDNACPGLHVKEFGVKQGADKLYILADLDSVPIPDRTLLPIDNYTSVLSKTNYVSTMITSRGCPYRCTFCKLNFQKNIACSAERVVDEFEYLERLGILEVEIYDDTFTWGRARLEAICRRIIERGVNINWAIRDRVNKADPEMLELMYRAGCRRIHYGIESGVSQVLKRMRKQITPDQAREAVHAAKAAGMEVLTFFMFGHLEETVDDMKKTVDFAFELNADYTTFSITIPYAGTEMYEECLRNGVIEEDFWREHARKPTANLIPKVNEELVSLDQMIELHNMAFKKFYFRPGYMWRQLTKVRSFPEFVRKIGMARRLVAL